MTSGVAGSVPTYTFTRYLTRTALVPAVTITPNSDGSNPVGLLTFTGATGTLVLSITYAAYPGGPGGALVPINTVTAGG
jgi:hypothetical protein